VFFKPKWVILFFLLIGVLLLKGAAFPQTAVPAFNPHNLIRFHVIANSDTAADQELKRQVRDAVLAATAKQLSAADIATVRRLVSQNLDRITALARSEIRRQGENYPVRAEIGDYIFPTRAYGQLVLAAGSYEAVRLVIGEGKGQNWWCVLFPPLCLVDAAGGLPEGVSADTYPVFALPASTKLPKENSIKVRWKLVELFNASRQRLADLQSRYM